LRAITDKNFRKFRFYDKVEIFAQFVASIYVKPAFLRNIIN